MNKPKRHVEVLVISDVHLGTYGCHAKELLHYLKSIKPKIVVLNGDIIDVWQLDWYISTSKPRNESLRNRVIGLAGFYETNDF